MSRLIIISGPSCVGKSPLHRTVEKFYPEIAKKIKKIVLYNSRSPRPGEIDGVNFHFKNRSFIEQFGQKQQFIVMDVRGDLQALDIAHLQDVLKTKDAIFEGNAYIGATLIQHPSLKDIEKISVFISPLSKDDIESLKQFGTLNIADTITDIMRRKLLRRTQKQKGILSLADLENIEKRAKSAYAEIKYAHLFDCIVPNYDGEDSENWDAFYYPIGSARKTLHAFVSLVQNTPASCCIEKWDKDYIR
jgi:guanylate kinase